MFRKITVLAIAVGVVAAMALPVSASANWKHHVTNIQQNVQLGLTTHHHQTGNGQVDNGNITFRSNTLGGGLQCQVTSAVTFAAGTTGTVDTFVPHPTGSTANCKGEGTLAFCQVHGVEAKETPWALHTTESGGLPTIQIHHKEIVSQIAGGFCPAGQVKVTAGTVVAVPIQTGGTPTNGNTVQFVRLQGTASVHTPAGSDPAAVVQGTFEVESPNANTYSL